MAIRLSALREGRALSPEIIIAVRGCVNYRTIVRPEGLSRLLFDTRSVPLSMSIVIVNIFNNILLQEYNIDT
jgi:hypothetical protein